MAVADGQLLDWEQIWHELPTVYRNPEMRWTFITQCVCHKLAYHCASQQYLLVGVIDAGV
jgi:hypothetical protein